MNCTIHDTKQFVIWNIGSPIHDKIHDSITMHKTILWEGLVQSNLFSWSLVGT